MTNFLGSGAVFAVGAFDAIEARLAWRRPGPNIVAPGAAYFPAHYAGALGVAAVTYAVTARVLHAGQLASLIAAFLALALELMWRKAANGDPVGAVVAAIERIPEAAAVITMDRDMRHPPEYLPRMVAAWREGHFVVRMARLDTAGASWHKKLSSNFFYEVFNRLSTVSLNLGAADIQLLDRRVVGDPMSLNDVRPFIRGMIAWLGYETHTFEYVAPPRPAPAASALTLSCARAISPPT